MTRRKPSIEPAAFDARQAAQYLNVALSHFHEDIRALIPVVDLRTPGAKKPMWRWLKSDLDTLVLQGLPFVVRERFGLNPIKAGYYATGSLRQKTGKHRTQTLRRLKVVPGNLHGMTLPAAVQRPDVLATLRASQGSQAVHRARRSA